MRKKWRSPSYGTVLKIKGLYFVCTCSGFPEQYDVYNSKNRNSDTIVGYVRVRGGEVRALKPYPTNWQMYENSIIYSENLSSNWYGSFEGDEDRKTRLTEIAKRMRGK